MWDTQKHHQLVGRFSCQSITPHLLCDAVQQCEGDDVVVVAFAALQLLMLLFVLAIFSTVEAIVFCCCDEVCSTSSNVAHCMDDKRETLPLPP